MTDETPNAASGEEAAELASPHKENLELVAKFDDREQARSVRRPAGDRAHQRLLRQSRLLRICHRIHRHRGSPSICMGRPCRMASTSIGPPFPWLQGMVSSNALLLTVAVLIRQNRMAQLAEHRSHLDLQINLLTEQKVTKIRAARRRSATRADERCAEAPGRTRARADAGDDQTRRSARASSTPSSSRRGEPVGSSARGRAGPCAAHSTRHQYSN
jgi:hypothetical protein